MFLLIFYGFPETIFKVQKNVYALFKMLVKNDVNVEYENFKTL